MTIVVQLTSTATNILYNQDILNWVMPDVPMAPVQLVNNAIRDSVIELCERALIWRTELQQILVLPPTTTSTTVAQSLYDQQLTVASTTNFNVGDTITVELTDAADPGAGAKWRGHVAGLPGGNVIQLDGQLPDTVSVGATVTKLVYLYPLTLPANTAVAKGMNAWLNDNWLSPMSPDDADTEFNNTEFGWVGVNWRTDVNLPTRWSIDSGDTNVRLTLAPNAAGNLRIEAALKPTRASTTFPTWIFERYIEAIAHGAKGKIMTIPKKPYSDKDTAKYHMDMFNGLIGEARIRMARGTTRAALRSHTVYGLR